MKKFAILLAVATLFCVTLAACGASDSDSTTSTQYNDETLSTTDGMFNGTPEDELNTVSEWVSEGMSDIGDGEFLDPDNGIISDTNPMD